MNMKRFPLKLEAGLQLVLGYKDMSPKAVNFEGTQLYLYCECYNLESAPFTASLHGSDKYGLDVAGLYVDTISTEKGVLHVYFQKGYEVC